LQTDFLFVVVVLNILRIYNERVSIIIDIHYDFKKPSFYTIFPSKESASEKYSLQIYMLYL